MIERAAAREERARRVSETRSSSRRRPSLRGRETAYRDHWNAYADVPEIGSRGLDTASPRGSAYSTNEGVDR